MIMTGIRALLRWTSMAPRQGRGGRSAVQREPLSVAADNNSNGTLTHREALVLGIALALPLWPAP
jgi:hypothetical protein